MNMNTIVEIIFAIVSALGAGTGGLAYSKHKTTQKENIELYTRLTKLEVIQGVHVDQFKTIDNKLDKIFKLVKNEKNT